MLNLETSGPAFRIHHLCLLPINLVHVVAFLILTWTTLFAFDTVACCTEERWRLYNIFSVHKFSFAKKNGVYQVLQLRDNLHLLSGSRSLDLRLHCGAGCRTEWKVRSDVWHQRKRELHQSLQIKVRHRNSIRSNKRQEKLL